MRTLADGVIASRACAIGPGAALAQQEPDVVLGAGVGALAEMGVADVAVSVDQVVGRPVLVPPRVPGAVVVVDRDRVGDAVLLHRPLHVSDDVLERELGRVHPDDHEAVAW